MEIPKSVLWAGVALAAVWLLVLILRGLALLFPKRFARWHRSRTPLQVRNGWINEVAELLCIVGFLAPFALFWNEVNEIGWPAIGFQFGAGVILPFVWICVVTLPFGFSRFLEFWRFYMMWHRTGVAFILAVLIPLGAIGVISTIELIKRGVL